MERLHVLVAISHLLKAMPSYALERRVMLLRPYRPYGNLTYLIKYFSSYSCVSTNVYLHDLYCNKLIEEKARWEIRKNNVCRFEWILKKHSIKQQLFSHLLYISKNIQLRYATYCWRSRCKILPWASSIWPHQCWPTSKNLYKSTLKALNIKADKDTLRKFQGNPCNQNDLMMMMMMMMIDELSHQSQCNIAKNE